MTSSGSSPELSSDRFALERVHLATPESTGTATESSFGFSKEKTDAYLACPSKDIPTRTSSNVVTPRYENVHLDTKTSRYENVAIQTEGESPSACPAVNLYEAPGVFRPTKVHFQPEQCGLGSTVENCPSTDRGSDVVSEALGSLAPPEPPPRTTSQRLVRRQSAGCLARTRNFLMVWQAWSLFLKDVCCVLPILYFFAIFFISFSLVGCVSLHSCPMDIVIPIMIVIVGFMGFLVTSLWIMYLQHDFCVPPYRRKGLLIVKAASIAFLILFSSEMCSFFRHTPNFKFGSESYCDPVFYRFCQAINFTIVCLLAILFVVFGPALLYENCGIGQHVEEIDDDRN